MDDCVPYKRQVSSCDVRQVEDKGYNGNDHNKRNWFGHCFLLQGIKKYKVLIYFKINFAYWTLPIITASFLAWNV